LFYIYRQITRKRKNIRAYHFEGQELYKYTFAQRVNIENKTMIFVTECRFDVNFAIITRLFRVVRSEKKLVLQNVFSSINKNLPQLQISETYITQYNSANKNTLSNLIDQMVKKNSFLLAEIHRKN